MLPAIEKMREVTKRKLSAQPNGGLPRQVDGRLFYMASPDYMAKYAKRLIQAGAKFVGGCCGTTPKHTKLMVDAVRAISPRAAKVKAKPVVSAKVQDLISSDMMYALTVTEQTANAITFTVPDRDGDNVRGTVTRLGTTFLEVGGRITEKLELPPENTRTSFYFKFLPSPDGKGFDAEPSLVYCRRTETTRSLQRVDAEVTLRESSFDPVADLLDGDVWLEGRLLGNRR